MPPSAPDKTVKHVFALLGDARISDRGERLSLYRWILHDPSVMSTNDLDETDLETIIHTLGAWQRQGEIEAKSRQAIDAWNRGEG